ncbi:NAD(P)/FAD-dependent oxidoreductase [Oscillospiraceae bacterium WX1]
MYDAVVIGGGAAGMLCAAVAASNGRRVLLLEKNERLGVKLSITGKGRCNLTNNCTIRDVLDNIPTGGRFLQSALNAFSPQDAMALFEKLGVPLKTERGNRVFPVSDRASDIVLALRRFAEQSGVLIKRAAATSILTDNGSVTGVVTPGETILCNAAVLCTGGLSYPRTGATGDGYALAESLGHTIIPPKPSLVPLEASPDICARMQGLTLKNVRLTVRDGGRKPVFEDFGELLFTHFGVSGPLVLSASAHMRDFSGKTYTLAIDLKPALDEQKLDARIRRDFEKYQNRDFANALGDLLHRTMIPVVIERSGVPADTKVHSVTRAQRAALLSVLKAFVLDVIGPRPIDEAIITSGGVDTREINPTTMASKRVSGLFFAGEIIDADAYTGGFNLQIAWSTAYAAGSHIQPSR